MIKIPNLRNFSDFSKKATTLILILVFFHSDTFSQNFSKNSPISMADGQKSMTASTAGFTENKGQMADMSGNPVPNVLFKTNIDGTDLYVTTSGITYMFLRPLEEKDASEAETAKLEKEILEQANDAPSKMEWVRVDMNLQGANISAQNLIKENIISEGRVDYYLGHCPNGIFDVKTYGKVTIPNIYPGIDWVFHSSATHGVKYDFVVHPGANPDNIKMQYVGKGDVELGENNSSLKIITSLGELVEGELYSFQNGNKKPVASSYVLDNGIAFFNIGQYNTNEDLTIDPPLRLWWSTYLGGNSNDGGRAITVDKVGNVYITGFVISVNFPMLNAYQGVISAGTVDAFITKFNNNGAMQWSTYYGGNEDDRGEGIAADNLGNVYVTGGTRSSTFPLKNLPGAYNQTPNIGATPYYDVMILKFDAAGVCQWATAYGGENGDKGMGITTDNNNNIYITGYAGCNNFPTTDPGGGAFYDNTYGGGDCTDFYLGGDACVLKFNAAGACLWGTLLGGNGVDVGLDIKVSPFNGNIFVTGFAKSTNFTRLNPLGGAYYQNIMGGSGFLYGDAYVTEFSGANYSMQWSTYFGGDGSDAGEGIDVDANGNVYIVGSSASTNLPVQNLAGAFNQPALAGPLAMPFYSFGDWFIVKFDNTRACTWATYYGGTRSEVALDVTVDPCGNVFVAGRTCSTNFPTFNGGASYYYDGTHNGGGTIYGDIGIISFDPNGVQTWGTFYGGAGDNDAAWQLALDWKGKIFLTGEYSSGGLGINPAGGAYYDASYNGGPNDAFVLSFKPLLKPTATQTPVTCYGANNGIATANPVGGVPAMTYSWSTNPTQLTQAALNLGPGIYSVTVTDANCAKDTVSVQVTQPPLLQASIPTFTNVMCNGNPSGGATASAIGGTVAYTYIWTPSGQTGKTASNLIATTYSVVITDANGCTATASTNITQPPLLTLNITSQNDVTCFGNNNGFINTSTAGGAGAYSYTWSNSPNTPNISNLGTGLYSLTVTDANNCSATVSASISEPTALLAFVPSQTDIRCYGDATGGASAGAIGGTGAYTYLWNPGAQATQSITNIIAGVYTVTITDNNGCTATKSVTLTEPPVLAANIISQTDILCNGNNTGSITVNAAGGIIPYNYSWNPSAQTSTTASGLNAGPYTVVVTDNNGCTMQANTTLTEPPVLTLNLSSTPDHCLLSDGAATAVAGGGTTNYTYSWSNSGATALLNNLGAGVYTLTLSDNNGCSLVNSVAVLAAQADTFQFVSKTGTSCYNGCDGTATLQLSGNANGPYTYAWSGTFVQNGLIGINFCAGVYTCTMTDANGCKDTMQVAITQPSQLTANINVTSVSCFGGNDGTATVQQNGGTAGYTYLWDNGQTNKTANNIPAGLFSCTVTDNNGCTVTAAATITEPAQLVVNTNGTSQICMGQTATINANVVGGTPAYTYSWNNGAVTSSIQTQPIATTNYNVTVTDSKGCTASAATTVSVNPIPDVSFTSDVVSGCGPLCVTFINNTANTATANWGFGNGAYSSTDPTGMNCYTTPGVYSVSLTVTDTKGCSATNVMANYITVHPDPIAAFKATPQPATILSPNVYFTDLSIRAISWQWTFDDLPNAQSAIQHPNYIFPDTGTYRTQLIVTNEFGCTDTAYKNIRINPDFVMYVPNTFTPNGDNVNDIFKPIGIGMEGEYYEFLIYDRWGDVIFKTYDPNAGWNGKANNGTDIAQQDTYVWRIVMKDVLNNRHRFVGNVNLIR